MATLNVYNKTNYILRIKESEFSSLFLLTSYVSGKTFLWHLSVFIVEKSPLSAFLSFLFFPERFIHIAVSVSKMAWAPLIILN